MQELNDLKALLQMKIALFFTTEMPLLPIYESLVADWISLALSAVISNIKALSLSLALAAAANWKQWRLHLNVSSPSSSSRVNKWILESWKTKCFFKQNLVLMNSADWLAAVQCWWIQSLLSSNQSRFFLSIVVFG
jgi:hypothetical protein